MHGPKKQNRKPVSLILGYFIIYLKYIRKISHIQCRMR